MEEEMPEFCLKYAGGEEPPWSRKITYPSASTPMFWRLTGRCSNFVNVALEGSELFAATGGHLYRLDPATGDILWENTLRGMGFGLLTIAQTADGNRSVMGQKRRQDEAAAAAT